MNNELTVNDLRTNEVPAHPELAVTVSASPHAITTFDDHNFIGIGWRPLGWRLEPLRCPVQSLDAFFAVIGELRFSRCFGLATGDSHEPAIRGEEIVNSIWMLARYLDRIAMTGTLPQEPTAARCWYDDV